MKSAKASPVILVILMFFCAAQGRRSFKRKKNIPELIVKLEGDEKSYSLKNRHINKHVLATAFDEKLLNNRRLPEDSITTRDNPKLTFSGSEMNRQIHHLMEEVERGKKSFSDFEILKMRDFDSKRKSGLVIAKFKDKPFVVKLFIETPESFVSPYSKGFEPWCVFAMGGSTRHLLGFTRIKNMDLMAKQIQEDPEWTKIITMPRKWFWTPRNVKMLEATGKNLDKNVLKFKFPTIYAIVCDEIIPERVMSLGSKKDRALCMRLSRFLDLKVDPHTKNFFIEKGTGKIALIDTEHFPTLVGLKRKFKVNGYFTWYMKLAGKCFKDKLFKSKRDITRRFREAVMDPVECYC